MRRRLAFVLSLLAPVPGGALRAPPSAIIAENSADLLYRELGLAGHLDRAAFDAGLLSMDQHGLRRGVVAFADMTQPSTAKRLYVVDLDKRKLVLNTYVAHGQGSGDLLATRFSNAAESHQSSLGLYRVGEVIESPRHGPALLLHGLDKGINDRALVRELIIHGAAYVSEAFIAVHGRLGRSWGCPAVPLAEMTQVIQALTGGGLLYVYGG